MSYPVAYPFALLSAAETNLQIGNAGSVSNDDSCALSCCQTKAPRRAGRAAAVRHRECLSGRGLAIVASLDLYRYLSAKQIEALHFHDHATVTTGARTCRRVLARLTDCGVLRRLERRVGGIRAGSVSFIYTLTPLGQRVLDEDSRRPQYREPSEAFLDHTLAVAQLAVDLHVLARRDGVKLLAVEPEPACWRRFNVGLESINVLKPDLYVSLQAGEFDYHWFVEVDRATHSPAAVLRKCRLYHRYWQTGIEQDRSGVFPRVLIVTPGLRRARLLQRTLASARHLKQELFAITSTGDAMASLTGATP